jgi:hypothetical protein
MAGVVTDPLSGAQIAKITDWVKSRLSIQVSSPTNLIPGQPLLASIAPLTSALDASELVNGVLNVALVQKDVLFKDLNTMSVPSSSTATGAGDLDGSSLLKNLETTTAGNLALQPFPIPTLNLGQTTPFPNQLAGLLAQVAGTLSLPKLSVSLKVTWSITDGSGNPLTDGVDMVAKGLKSGSLWAVITPAFKELNFTTIASSSPLAISLSASIELQVGAETPLTFTLPAISFNVLPLLVPTVVALFSEPNFGLTEDSAVVLLVPQDSVLSSAAPLFKELQRIEGVLDELRSIASVAGFLLGLSEVIALTEAPRLRFVSAKGIPKLKEIVLKHKPWYDFFGDDPNFDDRTNSLFVFGVPGTSVAFFNDFNFSTTSSQGFYTIRLNDIDVAAGSLLPDFFVAIRSYPTATEVSLDSSLSNRTNPPPTQPAGRINHGAGSIDFKHDTTGDTEWDTDLSSVKFVEPLLQRARS